jgi:hypothetical protein
MFGRGRLKSALICVLLGVACDRQGDDSEASVSALLPNSAILEGESAGRSYARVAEHFKSLGWDMRVDLDGFAPLWPVDDPKKMVLNRLGTPVIFSNWAYYNTGFDVLRSNTLSVPYDVFAPYDGYAIALNWSGNPLTEGDTPYTSMVAVYDSASHVVTELVHVAPIPALLGSIGPVPVTRGTKIGKLARAPLADLEANRMANAHVVMVDGAAMKLINPARYFAGYTDRVPPTMNAVYTTDEAGIKTTKFKSGKLDVVVEAFDRDDASERNLEVSAIAFSITDQDGAPLLAQPRCDLDHLYTEIGQPGSFRARDLVDFGSAPPSQIAGVWPLSDVGNPIRTFRYALTQLSSVDGRCSVKKDEDGFVEVSHAVSKLLVSITVWDVKDNKTTKSFEILRLPGSIPDAGAEGGAPDASAEAGTTASADAGGTAAPADAGARTPEAGTAAPEGDPLR